MMNLQELDTVCRYKQQMVLIVWNDNGFGAEVHKLRAKGFEPSLAAWETPLDFVALAKAFGGDGVRLQEGGRDRRRDREGPCARRPVRHRRARFAHERQRRLSEDPFRPAEPRAAAARARARELTCSSKARSAFPAGRMT